MCLVATWQKFDQDWYPDCWLLFLMYSAPAEDQRQILPSFQDPLRSLSAINKSGSHSPATGISSSRRESCPGEGCSKGRSLHRKLVSATTGDGGFPELSVSTVISSLTPTFVEPLVVKLVISTDVLDIQREIVRLCRSLDTNGEQYRNEAARLLRMLIRKRDELESAPHSGHNLCNDLF